MTPIRCIVVEDEPLAMERLVDYIRRIPRLDLVASFHGATDALGFVKDHPVDLVFLDVRLGGMSGLELLQTGALNCRVILTTAHEEYAVKAFDFDVADYLLKPYSFERFVRAVDRIQAMTSAGFSGARDFIFVKSELRLERVVLSEVLFIEGQRDYRRIHTSARRIMTLETFTALERRIAPDVICRIHKSYMVALDKIELVEGGRVKLRGISLPVSDTYRDRFLALIRR